MVSLNEVLISILGMTDHELAAVLAASIVPGIVLRGLIAMLQLMHRYS